MQTQTHSRQRKEETVMEKFLVPAEPSVEPPKPVKRRRWKRSMVELNGRFEPKYRHDMAGLLMQSYTEIGAFPHLYHIDGMPCETHVNRISNFPLTESSKHDISGLEFDNKGYYLAAVTRSGCLTIHDFEALYCQSSNTSSQCPAEIESKNVMHLSLHKRLDVVRWNISNQDEIACASIRSGEVLVFDIGYVSSEPIEILRARHTVTIHGSEKNRGFSDISFTSDGSSRVFASDTQGCINVWDRRASAFPYLQLTTNSHDFLSSIQLNLENQTIFGAGMHGNIYMWDLRGGRTSVGFQSQREASNSPFTALRLASALEKIGSLKAQSEIVPSKIQSIGLDPSCPYQLAFHLDDGWSGVLNIYNLCVTHLHCPPPPWLNCESANSTISLYDWRKGSWLPTYSIYMVGSATENAIYLLDFFPDATSPSHVDYDEDTGGSRVKQNRFIALSEGVTSCAAHPLNGTIIAGTKNASLLVLSQRHDRC
ncbi:uncharacterized protein LOC116201139 [Punica granatum]|uniref:Uncharacterized protein LOC116201139 n=1 Tax=Punica granatum TaxID=22663 RepID=A0A6P8DA89_PUNGR|nr:uncharacterized protein LOC116201139 [Punica granatum]